MKLDPRNYDEHLTFKARIGELEMGKLRLRVFKERKKLRT